MSGFSRGLASALVGLGLTLAAVAPDEAEAGSRGRPDHSYFVAERVSTIGAWGLAGGPALVIVGVAPCIGGMYSDDTSLAEEVICSTVSFSGMGWFWAGAPMVSIGSLRAAQILNRNGARVSTWSGIVACALLGAGILCPPLVIAPFLSYAFGIGQLVADKKAARTQLGWEYREPKHRAALSVAPIVHEETRGIAVAALF